MKKSTANKQQDSLLDAFLQESLTEKGSLLSITGGLDCGNTYATKEHTAGDIGNCDNDTRTIYDDGHAPSTTSS